MDLEDIWPTKSELNKLINGLFFTQDEVNERKIAAVETGFKTWDDFLDFVLESYKSIFDIPKTADEMSSMFDNGKMRGSIMLAVNNNMNESYAEKIKPVNERFMKLPEDVRAKAEAFDAKLAAFTVKWTLDNIQKKMPDGLEFTLGFAKDALQELESIDSTSKQESKLLHSVVDDFRMENSNKAIATSKLYFYLNANSHLFDQLHTELVKEKLVDSRPDFASLFENEFLKKGVEPIKWNGDLHELCFLLWTLNGKSEFIKGGTLDKMIHRLFQFDKNKSSENIRASFKRSLKKFGDENYISSRQKRITKILLDLAL